jgi:hypothetical protein
MAPQRWTKSIIVSVLAATAHLAFGDGWIRVLIGSFAGCLALLAVVVTLLAKDEQGVERAEHFAVASISLSGIGAVIYLFVAVAARSYV